MSSFTDYAETAIVQHVFMGVAFTPPDDIYLVLFTDAPEEDGTGGTEVAGGSYARPVVTFQLGTAGSGQVTNDAAISITDMPACTVVGAGLADASSGGNLLAYQDLGTPVTYTGGEAATLDPGELTFTLA